MQPKPFPFTARTANEMTWQERDEAYEALHDRKERSYLHPLGLQMIWRYEDVQEVLDAKTDGISNKNSLDPLVGYGAIARNPHAVGHFLRHLVPLPKKATANLTNDFLHSQVWDTMAGSAGYFAIASRSEGRTHEIQEHFYRALHEIDYLSGSSQLLDVTALSIVYAANVTGEAIGLPQNKWSSIAEWSGAQSGLLGQRMKGQALAQAIKGLGQLFSISDMALKEEEPTGFAKHLRETGLPHALAKSAMANSLAAGVHTISGTIQQGTERLLDISDRTWWDGLEDAKNTPRIARKVLQLDPGLVAWKRTATRPVTLKSGTKLQKGPILALFAAANRDKTSGLQTTDELSTGGRILTFGSGKHVCPGRQLANLAVEVFLHELRMLAPHATISDTLRPVRPYDLLFSGANVTIDR